MGSRLVLAVAGAGKTTLLTDGVFEDKRTLILTYTNNNYDNIVSRLRLRFGCVPRNVCVEKYQSFIYWFLVKPLHSEWLGRPRGIQWDAPGQGLRAKSDSRPYYLGSGGRVYANRMARLVLTGSNRKESIARLGRYFDKVMIDEVQDFAGYDFDFVTALGESGLDVLAVGDFHQHTYDTSRDGAKNRGLFDDIEAYVGRFRKCGFQVDREFLDRSYRCSPTVCKWISDTLGIRMGSRRTDDSKVCIESDMHRATAVYERGDVVKLFWEGHARHGCWSENWGASKGVDSYVHVGVVMTRKAWDCLGTGSLSNLPSITRNKLYVACTRARGDLYLLPPGCGA